jgi:hypothetical protein
MECSICLDDYNNKNTKKVLTCKHQFHSKCINKWFINLRRCPLCLNFDKKKYTVIHSNSPNYIFIHKKMFFHPKHLVFGRKLIQYYNIIQMRISHNSMYFETRDNKQYVISSSNKRNIREIYAQLKANIETKLRKRKSSTSIV